jgi:hypothetical protein
MDFLTPILNVPANRTLIKLVLVIVCVILALVGVVAFLDYYSRLTGTLLIALLVRIIQAEVNHVEIKELLKK